MCHLVTVRMCYLYPLTGPTNGSTGFSLMTFKKEPVARSAIPYMDVGILVIMNS